MANICFRPLAGLGQISHDLADREEQRWSSFRPLAGLGQISLYKVHTYEIFVEFPSPRGVGADLTVLT